MVDKRPMQEGRQIADWELQVADRMIGFALLLIADDRRLTPDNSRLRQPRGAKCAVGLGVIDPVQRSSSRSVASPLRVRTVGITISVAALRSGTRAPGRAGARAGAPGSIRYGLSGMTSRSR